MRALSLSCHWGNYPLIHRETLDALEAELWREEVMVHPIKDRQVLFYMHRHLARHVSEIRNEMLLTAVPSS